MFDALIKVGGSVCNTRQINSYAPLWAALARRFRLLFIAGGGLFADQVRALDQHLDLGDSAAHWMAIAAMEQNGYLLADLMPGVPQISDFGFRISDENPKSSAVLLPYSLLRQADPLPHGWEATSDSLAAWLAGYAGINLLVLLKDVPGVYQAGSPGASPTLMPQINRGRLAGCDVVDPLFSKVLPPQVETWIISGRHPDRLERLLETGRTEGTRIEREAQDS